MGSLNDDRPFLKPGDRVRLKKLAAWVTAQDSVMIVKHVGEFPDQGVLFGALCQWAGAHGLSHEKVYAVDDIVPV